jgi:murein L,D-transpeptidase YcbB/YkuD
MVARVLRGTALAGGAALAAWVAAACPVPAHAQAAPRTSAILQVRVDQMREGAPVRVGNEALASTVVLPEFYERRGFQPAWTDAAARADLLAALRGSAGDGLDPRDYHVAAIEALLRAPSGPESDADLDLLATDGVIRLAYHLRFGKVDVATLEPDWAFSPNVETAFREPPAVALQRAIDERKVAAGLDALRPTHWLYAALRRALEEYREIESAGGWPSLPDGPVLKPGAADARLRALEERLAAEGDLAVNRRESIALYDSALGTAVRRFQERHGLNPDGVIGKTTLRALNVPVATRISQLRISLERGRLLLHDLPERFVVVNIPAFRVQYIDEGRAQLVSRVVVGKPFTQTPIFRADMTYAVLNPSWTIPPGIMERDVIPGMKKDPQYLEKKGFVKVGGQVVQPPGPNNALGRIKLMFPNPHHVYLHDTPHRDKFAFDERTFSSGCIRVEKIVDLTAAVLDDDASWPKEKLEAAIATGATRNITLKRRLPVFLTYWTAAVDPGDERARFFDDVYGRDPAFLAALDQPFHIHRGAGSRTAAGSKR